MPRYVAVGLLELLWHTTATLAPRGDIGALQDDHIAEELYWQGDTGVLVEALVKTGWLDECSVHRLVVHDWKDHADQGVSRKKPVEEHGFIVAQTKASFQLDGNSSATSLPDAGSLMPEAGSQKPPARAGAVISRRVLSETADAFASYGRTIRAWSESRKRAMLARTRESGGDMTVLPAAVHGYAYYHRGSGDNGFDPMKHLTPETIFRASNFTKYLDAAKDAEQAGKSPPYQLGPEADAQRYARMAREFEEEERQRAGS